MAINFPSTPSLNDIHSHNGVSYQWDGSTWKAVGNTSIYTLPTASSTVLGGIKVGTRLTINAGVLEADVQGGTYADADVDTHLNQSNPTSGHVLSWNGSDYAWVAADTGASVTVSDNAPAGPSAGDLWWDSDNGRLKVYYTDATPDSQWVDTSPLGDSSTIGADNTSISVTDTNGNGTITVTTEGTSRWTWNDNGHLKPAVSGAVGSVAGFDIGNSSYKVREFHCSSANITPLNGITTTQLTASGDVTIDTDVLKVDTSQNRVGIGTASPNSLLHLYQPNDAVYMTFDNGQHNIEYWVGTTGITAGFFIEQGSSNNSLLTADASDYVSLYGAGTKRFETTTDGVKLSGGLQDKDGNLGTSGQILSSTGTELDWIDAPASGGSPGGSNTQLQINDNGAFGGCNIEYNPTHLDGGLEWANASGTPGAAIRVYHSSISGGDNSMIFYTGGGLLGTLNMRIFNNSVTVYGALTKGSGSFKIPHPLPALKDTKDLVHSFIEGPQCDNLYRGKVDLVGGTATVNLDTKSDMTTGTFVALNRDVQCFTTNETGWTAVKGSVSGNILTITAQDNTCTDTISWMVVGERQDDNIKSSILTDATGKLIMEPNQIPLPPTS